METLLPVIIGAGATVLLLTAGYLFGAKKGGHARQKLRGQNLALLAEQARLEERIAQHENDDASLRAAIQNVLTPLVQRDQLSYDMSHLEGGDGQQRNLTALLDQMADKGAFSGVLLSDDQGWPLATSTHTANPDRLGATSSLLLLLADRMDSDGSSAPRALMVYDAADMTTLCRVFKVGDQRLVLTAVSSGGKMSPEVLDPVLARLNRALLANRHEGGDLPDAG